MLERLLKALKDYDSVMCDLWDAKVSDEELNRILEEVTYLQDTIWQDVSGVKDKLWKNKVERGENE